jgi:cytochrome P450
MEQLQAEPNHYMAALQYQYGDVLGLKVFGRMTYFIFHPDGMGVFLQDNYKNYHKQVVNYELLHPLVGQGLLTSDGDTWFRQRRLSQPAFHRQRIADFADMMVRETERLAARWERAPQEPFNIHLDMTDLTLQIVGNALLGINLEEEAGTFGQDFMAYNETFGFKNLLTLRFPWLPTPTNFKRRNSLKRMDAFVHGIINSRRMQSPGQDDHGDLLGMLMQAVDEETGTGMTDHQLRDELMTILLAGHETTAIALSWAWYLLAKHPDTYQALQNELQSVLAGRRPTFEDIPQLKYTRMVFQESLRYYPPVWTLARGLHESDTILGYHIPAGSIVQINLQLLHHDPRFWENPERFDPERFSPERSTGRHKYAYIPFSAGPRKCIGDQFAMTEGILVLATLAQDYRPVLESNDPVETELLITQRPKKRIPIKMVRR